MRVRAYFLLAKFKISKIFLRLENRALRQKVGEKAASNLARTLGAGCGEEDDGERAANE